MDEDEEKTVKDEEIKRFAIYDIEEERYLMVSYKERIPTDFDISNLFHWVEYKQPYMMIKEEALNAIINHMDDPLPIRESVDKINWTGALMHYINKVALHGWKTVMFVPMIVDGKKGENGQYKAKPDFLNGIFVGQEVT